MNEARDELLKLSQSATIKDAVLHVQDLMETTDHQIKENLISQFGLSQLFDKFQDGGGVDTIHNVRNNIFSSDEVRQKLQPGEYNKKAFADLHGNSHRYKNINSEQEILKKSGNLIDVYTNEKVECKEKTDLDHVISTKEIFNDKGRLLAGISADQLANNEDNLHLVDASINRSMGAKNKREYADELESNKTKWKKQNKRDQANPNLTIEKKNSKDKNANNRLRADGEAIKKTDAIARKAYDKKINSYYKGKAFLGATVKNSAKQGLGQAAKAAIGVVIYQVNDALFETSMDIFDHWNEYPTLKERFSSFISKLKGKLKKIASRVNEIKDAAFSGLTGGIVSAITNTIVNIFKTTSKNIAKILNDSFTSLLKATKILCNNGTIALGERIKVATKIIATSLMATNGIIVADALSKVIATHVPMLAGLSDVIGASFSSIVLGIATAFVVYIIDNFGDVLKQLKIDFNTIMVGLTVNPKTIRSSYNGAMQKIDSLYKDLLDNIYDRYSETHRLQQLAYDLDLPTADQFNASIDLANKLNVDQQRILKNKKEILDFFNN